MTERTKWLLIVLGVVVVIAAVSFYLLSKWDAAGTPSPTGTVATSTDSAPAGTPGSGKPVTPATKPSAPRPSSGYSVSVHGTTETITSTAAGVAIDAPVNATVSQSRGVLSVRPPQSKNDESFLIQKTTASFSDVLPRITSLVNGTQNGFDALRSTGSDFEYNPGAIIGPVHLTKLRNRTVSGYPAVEMHIRTTASNGALARDFYLVWVHSGVTNWYIERTSLGLTSDLAAVLDTMFSSLVLTP